MKLTRRNALKASGATIGALILAPVSERAATASTGETAPVAAWSHDPASPIGPQRWDDIGYPLCGQGLSQSPVDIRTSQTVVRRGAPLRLHYAKASEVVVENTGHVAEVPAGAQYALHLGGVPYELTQYHFHAPSEHTIDGRSADLEAHFVHAGAQGETAVIGVRYQCDRRSNPTLDRILRAAPTTSGEEAPLGGEASPAELFRHIAGVEPAGGGLLLVNSYYTYDGSLTTPGCTQDVRWLVLAGAGRVADGAVSHLHGVISRFPDYDGYPNNNRPAQPRNGRRITHVRHQQG